MQAIVRVLLLAIDSYWRYDSTQLDPSLNSEPQLVTGLILARSGSKGIPHKNLVELNGKPLIHWALEAMVQSGVFNTIWVSTDDPEVKRYVLTEKTGIFVHDRADYTATDEATSILAVQEFIKSHPEMEGDYLCLVQATSPLIHPHYLMEGFNLINSKLYDSVFSVTRHYKLRWSEIDKDNKLRFSKALNFNPFQRPRRQDWKGEMIENGMFYFSKKELLVRGAFQGEKSTYVEIPKEDSLEIDTPEDLEFAEILLKRKAIELIPKANHTKYYEQNEKRVEL